MTDKGDSAIYWIGLNSNCYHQWQYTLIICNVWSAPRNRCFVS